MMKHSSKLHDQWTGWDNLCRYEPLIIKLTNKSLKSLCLFRRVTWCQAVHQALWLTGSEDHLTNYNLWSELSCSQNFVAREVVFCSFSWTGRASERIFIFFYRDGCPTFIIITLFVTRRGECDMWQCDIMMTWRQITSDTDTPSSAPWVTVRLQFNVCCNLHSPSMALHVRHRLQCTEAVNHSLWVLQTLFSNKDTHMIHITVGRV